MSECFNESGKRKRGKQSVATETLAIQTALREVHPRFLPPLMKASPYFGNITSSKCFGYSMLLPVLAAQVHSTAFPGNIIPSGTVILTLGNS